MYELKLRKKLLSQQLSMVDDKFDRMARILDKKLTQKGLPTKQTRTLSKTKPKVRGGVPSPPRKSLMKPQPIESGSQFDMVRKRNVIRHQKALLERKVSFRAAWGWVGCVGWGWWERCGVRGAGGIGLRLETKSWACLGGGVGSWLRGVRAMSECDESDGGRSSSIQHWLTPPSPPSPFPSLAKK
jgi:hypothetical protein